MITRPSVSRHVASSIPAAEYFEIPEGTHYAVMEFPEEMARRMDQFIRERLD